MLKHFSSFSFFQFVHIYFHHLKKKKKEILIISIHFLYLTPSVIKVFYQNQTDLIIFYILLLSIYQQKPTQSILPNDCYRLFIRLPLINKRNQYYQTIAIDYLHDSPSSTNVINIIKRFLSIIYTTPPHQQT